MYAHTFLLLNERTRILLCSLCLQKRHVINGSEVGFFHHVSQVGVSV